MHDDHSSPLTNQAVLHPSVRSTWVEFEQNQITFGTYLEVGTH